MVKILPRPTASVSVVLRILCKPCLKNMSVDWDILQVDPNGLKTFLGSRCDGILYFLLAYLACLWNMRKRAHSTGASLCLHG